MIQVYEPERNVTKEEDVTSDGYEFIWYEEEWRGSFLAVH